MYSGNAYPSFLSTARNTINQEHLQAITTADAQAFGASIGYPSSSFNPMMDIESWMCETSRLSDIAMSYSSGGQPPSIGDVRQIVVSERSGSYQMYSDGQPPSINDVGMREPSQSEASCNRYEGSEEHEVQQVISEFNDGVYKRGAIGRSTDVDEKVSSSFGVPHMTFNFMDSTINNGGLLNGQVWAPQQQPQPQPFQRMRTYTKVLKRGAISRSIDVTAYSGYEELKQDLARRFGIEGQLVDGHNYGYKLVYVDHENDVLLVGPDPWEEFVNCVSSIKILSSQEVQQICAWMDISQPWIPFFSHLFTHK